MSTGGSENGGRQQSRWPLAPPPQLHHHPLSPNPQFHHQQQHHHHQVCNSKISLASQTQESLPREQQADHSHKRLPAGEQWRERKRRRLLPPGRRQRASRRGGALSECTVTIPMLFKFHSLAASATRLWGRLVLPGRLRHARRAGGDPGRARALSGCAVLTTILASPTDSRDSETNAMLRPSSSLFAVSSNHGRDSSPLDLHLLDIVLPECLLITLRV